MDTLHNSEKARFMGTITASVTHEIQNVLAIIKENSGLMEDLILMSQDGTQQGIQEKLNTCIKKIKKQSYRGVSLTSMLNTFAHGPDVTAASINIADTVKKLIAVSERIFKLKEIDIQFIDSGNLPSIITDPVFFQLIIFSCMNCLIENFKTRSLLVNFKTSQEKTCIMLSVPDVCTEHKISANCITQADSWKTIQDLGRKSNTAIDVLQKTTGICISFPAKSE